MHKILAELFNLNDFPVLDMNKNNVDDISSSLWKPWLIKFRLCVTIRRGKETVNGVEHDVFKERMKLLALLYAVGKKGKDVLKSLGFDLHG